MHRLYHHSRELPVSTGIPISTRGSDEGEGPRLCVRAAGGRKEVPDTRLYLGRWCLYEHAMTKHAQS